MSWAAFILSIRSTSRVRCVAVRFRRCFSVTGFPAKHVTVRVSQLHARRRVSGDVDETDSEHEVFEKI